MIFVMFAWSLSIERNAVFHEYEQVERDVATILTAFNVVRKENRLLRVRTESGPPHHEFMQRGVPDHLISRC